MHPSSSFHPTPPPIILPVQKDLTRHKEALKIKLIDKLKLGLTSIKSFMRWVEDQDRSNPQQTQIDWKTYENPSEDDMNDLMTCWTQYRATSHSEKTVINPALTPEPKDADTIQSLLKKMNGIDDGTIMAFTKYQTTQPHEFELLDKWSSFKRSHAMKLVKEINGLANNQLTPIEFDAFLEHSGLEVRKFYYPLPDMHKIIRNKWTSFKEESEIQALGIMIKTDKARARQFLVHLRKETVNFEQLRHHERQQMFNDYIAKNLEEQGVKNWVNVRRGIPLRRPIPRPLPVLPPHEDSGKERTTTFFDGLKGLKSWMLSPTTLTQWSGRLDSNQRPLLPQSSALTGLRYAPNIVLLG